MSAINENEEFEFRLRAEQEAGQPASHTAPPKEDGYTLTAPSLDNLTTNLKTVGKGALGGAMDIGNTLINASTFIPRKLSNLAGSTAADEYNDRREAGVKEYNNNDDPLFQVGRIGGQVAGTAGVGGALAPIAKAANLPNLANAIRTGGMAASNLWTKVAGGAINGAAQAGLINPESAGTGAVIGGGLPVVAKGLTLAGKGIANLVGGLGTHTGGQGLQEAAKAGFEGGQRAKTFTDNMRGNVPMTDVLDTAKANLQNMAQTKAAEYRAGMAQVSGDKTVLSFQGIDDAINKTKGIVTYKGQSTNVKAADIQQKIAEAVNKWKGLNPTEFHTPEGLDALKKQIGGIQESIPFEEKTARKVAGDVYSAIKKEISKQAPTYAKTMKGYQEASELISEIERSLVGSSKTSVDTSMRKLQSLMRNNVNTNYGNRLNLARLLEEQGGNEIMPALAGQSLNSVTPRGLGGVVAGGLGLGGYAVGGPLGAAGTLAVQSPRLMGETALKTGQLARLLKLKTTPATGALANLLYGE